uniref:Uncharacterized protein n=1 Tax=viral metagenome TaxID=1070528 RepID=A0A6C0HSX4_9ZZZZ
MDLIDFDYVVLPSTPSYYDLEQNVISQKKKIDELTETVKEMQLELQKMKKNKMKHIDRLETKLEENKFRRIEGLESKFKVLEEKTIEELEKRQNMRQDMQILKQIHNNLMIEFYYIELSDVMQCLKKFQTSYIYKGNEDHRLKHIAFLKKSNEEKLKLKINRNISFTINDDIQQILDEKKNIRESYEFVVDESSKLNVKKIEFPVNSKLVDLRNLIIISPKDVICHFYNIQELKYCPYTIRKSSNGIETVIHLSRENFIINYNDKIPVTVPDYLNISEKNYEKSFIDYTHEELSVQMKSYHF